MSEEIIVLASGGTTGGGSGLEKLIQYFANVPDIDVVGVVSNIAGGGVEAYAHQYEIPFLHLPNAACTPEGYGSIAMHFGAANPWYACSGYLRFVIGLDPARTFNIHPALLSHLKGRFGGEGMYGHHVHEAVKTALEAGELDEPGEYQGKPTTFTYSGFTMHFVIGEAGKRDYDRGPAFAEIAVAIKRGMTPDEIGSTVNKAEHRWQSLLTEMVVRGQIRFENGNVITPSGYGLLPKVVHDQ